MWTLSSLANTSQTPPCVLEASVPYPNKGKAGDHDTTRLAACHLVDKIAILSCSPTIRHAQPQRPTLLWRKKCKKTIHTQLPLHEKKCERRICKVDS
jgi:hypothetical protein